MGEEHLMGTKKTTIKQAIKVKVKDLPARNDKAVKGGGFTDEDIVPPSSRTR